MPKNWWCHGNTCTTTQIFLHSLSLHCFSRGWSPAFKVITLIALESLTAYEQTRTYLGNFWKNPKGQSVLSKSVLIKHLRPKGKILALFGDKLILYYCNFDSILSHYNAVFQQFLYFIPSNQKLHLNITDKTWASLGFQTCWCHHLRGHYQGANFGLVI